MHNTFLFINFLEKSKQTWQSIYFSKLIKETNFMDLQTSEVWGYLLSFPLLI